MSKEHSILDLCQALAVSRSGYYDWKDRAQEPGPRAAENQLLRAKIALLHEQSRQTYGSPRIQKQLARQGSVHGRNRIARIMHELGVSGRQRRRYRVLTTQSNHDLPIAPNLLAQAAPPTQPNQIWVGDITYIDTAEGWLYLAAVMDLYSRRIVGWSMSEQIDTTLVLDAWNMAVTRRQPAGPLIFHSDRGIQYASHAFRQALARQNVTPSMSRKGNCYDNAAMESFWSTLKLELIYRHELLDRTSARTPLFDYIEAFYNTRRMHSSLGQRSPMEFEALPALSNPDAAKAKPAGLRPSNLSRSLDPTLFPNLNEHGKSLFRRGNGKDLNRSNRRRALASRPADQTT